MFGEGGLVAPPGLPAVFYFVLMVRCMRARMRACSGACKHLHENAVISSLLVVGQEPIEAQPYEVVLAKFPCAPVSQCREYLVETLKLRRPESEGRGGEALLGL